MYVAKDTWKTQKKNQFDKLGTEDIAYYYKQ